MIIRNALAEEIFKLAAPVEESPEGASPSSGESELKEGPSEYWTQRRQKARAHRVFKNLHGRMRTEGVLTGAGKYRVAVPKHVLTKQDLEKHLGFVPVNIAVPESGQRQFGSWRHPYHNNHVHDHDSHWVMHEDDHASTTMLMHKRKLELAKIREARRSGGGGGGRKGKDIPGLGDIAKTTIQGMPHLIGEGGPGILSYTKNRILGREGMLSIVQKGLPKQYHRRVRRMKASPTYQRAAAGSHDAREQMRHVGRHANQMRQSAMRKQAALDELRRWRKS